MKIIALGSGTSQGIPVIGCTCDTCTSSDSRDKRLRSSIYVETNASKVAIDIGPDFRQQFITNELHTVDHVLITHEHNDHVIGLDDIRAINFIQKKTIPFYAEKRVANELEHRFSYAFKNKSISAPRLDLNIIDENPFQIDDILVTPLRIMHGSLPILGYKLNDLVYITDASQISKDTLNKIYKCKLLIINALRKEKHYSHFTLSECLEIIKEVKPEQSYITHVSHAMGPLKEWKKELPPHVNSLYDTMRIEI